MRTAVTVGLRGTDENPNRTGGTADSSSPHGSESHVARTWTTRR